MSRIARLVTSWAIAWACTGCVRSNLVDCADDLACPVGLVCHVQACVDPALVAACEGSVDEAPCAAAADGRCLDGLCVEGGCGNAIVELTRGEVCDDGNNINGDGCAANCRSTERCGNGVHDPGEQCDDGNFLSHDGCSSICTQETPTWRRHGEAFTPPVNTSVAYDAARDHLLVFGGTGGTGGMAGQLTRATGRLWPDGTSSTALATLGPGPRMDHAMAFDAARGEVVMFGGSGGSIAFSSDTWLWNGQAWRRAEPATRPPPALAVAVYDAMRKEVVMLTTGFFNASQTWLWNGQDWRQANTPGPPPRFLPAMAYDPSRGEVVLFGGQGLGDTWTWDGTAWQERMSIVPTPSPRTRAAMGWDGTQLVLFGGESGTRLADMWRWDGTQWSPISIQGTTPPAMTGTAASDGARGRVIVVGVVSNGGVLSTEQWVWDGTTSAWSKVDDRTAIPGVTRPHVIGFDARRGEAVLVRSGTSPTQRTWVWNGRWTQAPAPSVQATDPTLAFDHARGELLMLAQGASGLAISPWQGAAGWGAAVALPGPTAELGSAFGAHPDGDLVVYGGAIPPVGLGAPTFLDEHWRLAPVTYAPTPLVLDPSPARLAGASVATDRRRGEVVVFGGRGPGLRAFKNALWEWNGARWQAVVSSETPNPREAGGLSYDDGLGRVILFGGSTKVADPFGGTTGTTYADTWEWDGLGWTEVITAGPTALVDVSLTYDAIRQSSILVGVDGGTQTWTYRYTSAATEEACGWGRDLDGDGLIGCADPDCWGRCTPGCPPGLPCGGPRCGDGTCTPSLEDARLCPGECPLPPASCGDFFCDPSETAASCPGDCS